MMVHVQQIYFMCLILQKDRSQMELLTQDPSFTIEQKEGLDFAAK